MEKDNKSVQFTTRQLIPGFMCILGATFAYLGFTKYGFWDHEPKPGFFPAIFGIVLVVSSVMAFFQTLSETEQIEYRRGELEVIIGGMILIIGSLIIGMIPMVFVYLLGWLKIMEKAPFKTCLIIMAVVGAIVIGVFMMWLQVQFPWGVFEGLVG